MIRETEGRARGDGMDLDHGVDGMGIAWVEGTAQGACRVRSREYGKVILVS